jgi:DNA (cytosine-5)-methyltransferase 1
MGGLKLILRCLTDMKYQVRYGVLQGGKLCPTLIFFYVLIGYSANFGLPQDRERFFFIAALSGHPLPAQLAGRKNMDVPLHGGGSTKAREMKKGRGLFSSVSIGDAIGDLVSFDW